MISRAAILERAAEWQLTPTVVEKDYVLGWLLAGLSQHPATGETWVFKGGTCLKKCVLETYRFSEDLDFTLRPHAVYDADVLALMLAEVTTQVTDASGIQFPPGELRVRSRKNRAGDETFEASIGYIGPLAFQGPPKIRLDLTKHEPVLRPVELRTVFHPYPDKLPADLRVRTYAIGELVAEKTRALCERTRPRDLYDVVLLGADTLAALDAGELRIIAREKFAVKSLTLPSVADVCRMAEQDEELRSEWENMLGHQLPATPSLDDFLRRLPEAIRWLDERAETAKPSRAAMRALPLKTGETRVAPRGIYTWGVGVPLEAVRYAGASHLVVEFYYRNAIRRVEPYSLRRPKTGNLLLYAHEQTKNGARTDDIRAYKIAHMSAVRVTAESFTPRYAIDLTEQSGVWHW